MDHTGQENIWFVGCLTTARATPASREGAQFLANVGTFCVDAVLGHSVSTIKLNGRGYTRKTFHAIRKA